jgi:tetratricopeptide (TPR) repeat protein
VQAIDTLKSFEKKDQKLAGAAATNLSFLYFLEGEYKHAEKYAEVAINADRYNAKALTNLGNCHFHKALYDKAKNCYQDAISVDATCTEAMYNLGTHYFDYFLCMVISKSQNPTRSLPLSHNQTKTDRPRKQETWALSRRPTMV